MYPCFGIENRYNKIRNGHYSGNQKIHRILVYLGYLLYHLFRRYNPRATKRLLVLTSEGRKDLNFISRLHKAGYAVHVTVAPVGLLRKLAQINSLVFLGFVQQPFSGVDEDRQSRSPVAPLPR